MKKVTSSILINLLKMQNSLHRRHNHHGCHQRYRLKKKWSKKKNTAETNTHNFSISAPVNDQTIWNEPDLMVSLKLTPALNTAEGHTTWLLMDGKPIVKNSQSLSLQIGRSDRGQHTAAGADPQQERQNHQTHQTRYRAHQKHCRTKTAPLISRIHPC